MPVITDSEKAQVRGLLERGLTNPVRIIHFTSYESSLAQALLAVPSHAQHYYEETRQLLHEVAGLSEKLQLEVHDIAANSEGAARYRIDKVPATVLVRGENSRIRYFGIPSGYEFSTFVGALVDVSRGTYVLMPDTREKLAKFTNPVHIQLFTTTH